MATTQEPQRKLHFLLIPFMAQGHLIPMVDIARILAKRAVTVTVATTPLNAARFESILERDRITGLDINVLKLQFSCAEAGLPKGCESLDTLPSPSLTKYFMHAVSLLQKPLEDRIVDEALAPSCIVSDKHVLWTAETARRFNVPRILFDGMSCFTLLCFQNLHECRVLFESEDKPFSIPGMPERVEVTRAQLPGLFNPSTDAYLNAMREKIRESEVGAYGFVVNSFEELEREYLKGYTQKTGQQVWCVGPVSLCNEDDSDKAERGKTNMRMTRSSNDKEERHECLSWLDKCGPKSVVYACLGSLNRLMPTQIVELGLALESSNRPFIWVIRGAYMRDQIDTWLQQSGFEDRVKVNGQGLLIRGWAPQVLILSHPSIGAFLTHCGWNSTLEGVSCGVPMVTWPLFAEQFLNEKLVVNVLDTGVSVGAQRVIHLGEEERFGGFLVRRAMVEEAIEKVMSEGRDGKERRARARKLALDAKRAVEKGGSSYRNVTSLLEDVEINVLA